MCMTKHHPEYILCIIWNPCICVLINKFCIERAINLFSLALMIYFHPQGAKQNDLISGLDATCSCSYESYSTFIYDCFWSVIYCITVRDTYCRMTPVACFRLFIFEDLWFSVAIFLELMLFWRLSELMICDYISEQKEFPWLYKRRDFYDFLNRRIFAEGFL